jgi:acyl transferase domain-containing protein
MADDWRVELDVEDHDLLHRALDRLRERGVARDARHRLGEGVVISVDADRIFAYAQTREQAREAASVLADLAEAHHLAAHATIARWHPEEERWEAPDVPLPETPSEHQAEHERRDALEEQESATRGLPEWEVRVELPEHRDAVALEERLAREGVPVVRRSRYVIAGAATEDDARALADRIRTEVPPDAKVTSGGSREVAWDDMHPFGFLGGIGN